MLLDPSSKPAHSSSSNQPAQGSEVMTARFSANDLRQSNKHTTARTSLSASAVHNTGIMMIALIYPGIFYLRIRLELLYCEIVLRKGNHSYGQVWRSAWIPSSLNTFSLVISCSSQPSLRQESVIKF